MFIESGYLSNGRLPLSFDPVWPFSFKISYQQGISAHRSADQWMFFQIQQFLKYSDFAPYPCNDQGHC